MKNKILFFLPALAITIVSFSQPRGPKIFRSNDSTLSFFIKDNFYSEPFADTCYMGIHFAIIEFQKNETINISISGFLNEAYKKRMAEVILSASKNWDQDQISDCLKNKKVLVQPILFDINKNCTYNSNIALYDSTLNGFNKEKIYELSLELQTERHLSLIESFKQLLLKKSQIFSNCILFSPCYIGGRPMKKKIEM